MKKIAYLLSTNELSGAEKIVIEIIDNIKDRYDCTYICKDGEVLKELKRRNIKYMTYSSNKELVKLLNKSDFDLIHANDYRASIAAACSNKKVLSHIHNNKIELTKISKLSVIYTALSFRFKKILAVSNSIIDEMYFKNFIKNKTVVKYNWVNDQERFWEKDEVKDIDILSVGRFEEQKNPQLFLEVVNEIVKNYYKDLKVVMIGRGSLKDEIVKYIKDNSLENNVTIKDFTDIPHKYMKKSKIFFMPSRWEGFGLVIVEAMINDSFIIATPVGGINEIFKDNNEFLYKEKDEFVNAIINVLKNDEFRKEVVEKNKKILKRFNMKENIGEIEKLYQEILTS